jgi:hypothetical protein
MAKTKIDSADYTDMTNIVTDYSSPAATSTSIYKYQMQWDRWHSIYKDVAILAALINAKAFWTVGKGYKGGSSRLQKIRGNGKQTFNTILYNGAKVYTIGGDFYAEIVENPIRKVFTKLGEFIERKIINLKPLNPGSIKTIAKDNGMIEKYEQWAMNSISGKPLHVFRPDQIFHLSWDSIADQIHGNGTCEKLEGTVAAYNEAKADMRKIFHRYVKPLLIFFVDTDDPAEIAAFKLKVDKAVELGENMVLPYDTLKDMEKMSIPQYSTLDPMPWIANLERDFILAENCPSVIIGSTEEKDTEASAKVLYLSWQQVIEWNQLFIEEQTRAQLGEKIKLEFPASLEPALQGDNAKARKMDNMESGIGQASGGKK